MVEEAATTKLEPSVDVQREVRLALVMYGGVSLAIYMNGVAQELFHLVRSTAPKDLDAPAPSRPLVPDKELISSERVYRKLGQLLLKLSNSQDVAPKEGLPGDVISTRFVVDIISGTSAGGINGIFLSKALANHQEIAPLKKLWLDEGDIAVLLNDARSRYDGLTLEHPPESLLNSGRMYAKLLNAFEQMEPTKEELRSGDKVRSPYVEELDLWVTTTDLRGVTLPLQSANGVAYERRYKNVFHFVYGTDRATGGDRNDFKAFNNPMLAFAARCTSAFPIAFKPMILSDMKEALQNSTPFRGVDPADSRWKSFYRDYFPDAHSDSVKEPEQDIEFKIRPFADGGALDNKPFTWATATLLRRQALVPVDRKLIYIEPDPGHPENASTPQGRPNALDNFFLQTVSLPRQETVRDDFQAVLDRNRTIVRVNRILHGLDEDLRAAAVPEVAELEGSAWAEQGIEAEATGSFERLGYHRLKVATVTDDLANLIASVRGFDEASDEFAAIRYLVRAWRDANYDYRAGVTTTTFNSFLLDFDLAHRLRRLTFLIRRTEELSLDPPPNDPSGYLGELRQARRDLNAIFLSLRRLGRRLRSSDGPLQEELGALGVTAEDLITILDHPREEYRTSEATRIYLRLDKNGAFENLSDKLAKYLAEGIPADLNGIGAVDGTKAASGRLKYLLDASMVAEPGAVKARSDLYRYFNRFDDYDAIAFPVLYGTDAGETDVVEIIRISPEDAKAIVDEGASGFDKRKTRGYRYFHFGAFLDPDWRKNDILFGRLDAAECLINALVPRDYAGKKALLDEALAAIILDELTLEEKKKLLDPSKTTSEEVVKQFAAAYTVSEQLPAKTALPIVSRGADVLSKVFQGISSGGLLKKPTAWIARIASALAGLVSVAVPGSSGYLVFRHLAPLLLLFEGFLLALGIAFSAGQLRQIAILALILTAATSALVAFFSSLMRGGRWWVRIFRWIALAIGSGLLVVVLVLTLASIGRNTTHPSRYWHDLTKVFHRHPSAHAPIRSDHHRAGHRDHGTRK